MKNIDLKLFDLGQHNFRCLLSKEHEMSVCRNHNTYSDEPVNGFFLNSGHAMLTSHWCQWCQCKYKMYYEPLYPISLFFLRTSSVSKNYTVYQFIKLIICEWMYTSHLTTINLRKAERLGSTNWLRFYFPRRQLFNQSNRSFRPPLKKERSHFRHAETIPIVLSAFQV